MNTNRKKLVVAGLLALLAAGAALGIRAWVRERRLNTSAPTVQGRYQCAMHPFIISDKPGTCPICGMPLHLVDEAAAQEARPAPVSAEKPARRRVLFYRHPMRPDVTSPVPMKDEMGMDYVPVHEEEAAAGTGDVPGHASFSLSLERQQLIGVTTARVERRDLNLEIRTVGRVAYDPELYNALAEYREAQRARAAIQESPWPEAHERAEALIRAAALKLRVMGLSQKQINVLVQETPDPTNLLLPGQSVWIYAQVYEYEIDQLHVGQEALVTAPSQPGKTFTGKIRAIDPVLDPMTRSVRVRVEISTPSGRLRPESFVHVKIRIPLGRKLAVPDDAIVDTGESQFVFVRKGAGEFEPRLVEVGSEAQGGIEILSGLSEGEEVVTSANFLIDSESRFRSAVKSFSGHHSPSSPPKGGRHD